MCKKSSDPETLVSDHLNQQLKQLKQQADAVDIADDISQEEYFLRDFSTDEIHAATAECRRLLQGIRLAGLYQRGNQESLLLIIYKDIQMQYMIMYLAQMNATITLRSLKILRSIILTYYCVTL